jgi:hypothetical protein
MVRNISYSIKLNQHPMLVLGLKGIVSLEKLKRGDKAKTKNGLGYRKAKPELPRRGTLLHASGAARRGGGVKPREVCAEAERDPEPWAD